MNNGPVKYEHSSGGVLIRSREEGLDVCLIVTQKGHRWQLPKGHIEKGEDPRETARREVVEETGCKGRVIALIDKIEFAYEVTHVKNGGTLEKDVAFFLMEYESGEAGSNDREVVEVRWLPVEEAIDKLTFDNEREVLYKALEVYEMEKQSKDT
jgi:8-oxo-dGTP diphosphatase